MSFVWIHLGIFILPAGLEILNMTWNVVRCTVYDQVPLPSCFDGSVCIGIAANDPRLAIINIRIKLISRTFSVLWLGTRRYMRRNWTVCYRVIPAFIRKTVNGRRWFLTSRFDIGCRNPIKWRQQKNSCQQHGYSFFPNSLHTVTPLLVSHNEKVVLAAGIHPVIFPVEFKVLDVLSGRSSLFLISFH